MSKAPSGWTFENLGKYIQILSGYAFKSEFFTNDKKFIPIIRIRDILDGKVETFYQGEYDKNYLVTNGDILVGMDGDFHITKWRAGKSLLNQRVCKITTERTAIDDFIFHFLSKVLPEINSLTASTTVKHLSTKDLNEYLGYFPPINEQKKIAEILSSVDRVIELTTMEIDKLNDLKRGIMQELLTKGIGHSKFKDSSVGKIPDSWEVVSLASTVNTDTVITYGIVQAGPHVENGIPYIKTGDMSGDSIELSKLQRTSKDIAAKFKRSEVVEGDIVFSLRGNIGKVMLVAKSISGANLTQGTAKISVKANISSSYIMWALRSSYIMEQYRNVVKGTTFQEITLGDLRELKVCLPPTAEREEIVSTLQSIEDKIDFLKSKNSKFEFVKKGLMNDLLTGKVRVKV